MVSSRPCLAERKERLHGAPLPLLFRRGGVRGGGGACKRPFLMVKLNIKTKTVRGRIILFFFLLLDHTKKMLRVSQILPKIERGGCVVSYVTHIPQKRPTLMGTKNLYENGLKFFFLLFFRFYGNENGPDSYSQIRLSVS